jgi:hypothetical protein
VLNKIRREEFKIDTLLKRNTKQEEWNFQSEAALGYRHAMIPFYLLDRECSEYPRYVDTSNLKLK